MDWARPQTVQRPSRKLRTLAEYKFSCGRFHADSLPQAGPDCYPGIPRRAIFDRAEHGQKAGYVRNIAVSPRARLNAEKSKKNDYRLSATAVCPLSMSPA